MKGEWFKVVEIRRHIGTRPVVGYDGKQQAKDGLLQWERCEISTIILSPLSGEVGSIQIGWAGCEVLLEKFNLGMRFYIGNTISERTQ